MTARKKQDFVREQAAADRCDRNSRGGDLLLHAGLVVLFGVLGLSHLVGVLDHVVLPALLFFVGLIVYALITKRRAVAERAESR